MFVMQKYYNRNHQKLRMKVLSLLYIYIIAHLTMWYVLDLKLWGKTAMVGVPSLLAGHINPAAIMIVIILASIFIYGRAFCGWACHMRGAIEFADWVMIKMNLSGYLKIRRDNILLNTRYRWLLRIGALYILLIPVIVYLWKKGFKLEFNLLVPPPLSDLPSPDMTSSLDNESLWNHFPLTLFDPAQNAVLYFIVAFLSVILIIFIMSFVLNYFYGQGAFCRILCPYAVLLVPLMNLSPWQKKITRVGDCTGCRKCSNACPQGVDVSREIYHYDGKVKNRECIKCFTCVDICDNLVLKDSNLPSVLQITLLKGYKKRPWLSENKHLQIIEPIATTTDFVTMILSLLTGAAFSSLGGFHFFVGAIIGYIIFRKVVLLLSSQKIKWRL